MATSLSTSQQAPPRASALDALQFPVYRRVLIASTISNLGALIQSVGAAWMMTSLTTAADMVALVHASMTLPVVLLSLIGGALADSFDRRKIMLMAQICMLIVSVALSFCAWAGWMTPWLLLGFTFLVGCGVGVNAPAWQASVGDMVPRSHLAGAVALNGLSYNVARSLGPALGGVIVAAAGAAAAFAVNSASYIALIGVLARWRKPRAVQALPRESLAFAAAAGVRYVWMSPALLSVLGRGAIFGLGACAAMALMPLIAKERIAGGPLTYGLLLGSFGFGAILGAIGSARLRQKLTTEWIVRSSSIAMAIGSVVAGVSEHLALSMAALVLAGASWVLALSTFNVSVQLSTPRWVVARALSLYQMATFGGMAMGSWLWGVVAEVDSIQLAMSCATGVLLCCAVIGRWIPMRQAEVLNLDPWRMWEAPATAVPVEPRTGPVVVVVEYRIAEADVLEFLRAMEERRRIRKRDGARNWMLLRDLADAEIWIERYNVPTWSDYIRHNNRLTQEDAVIPTRLRALHRGPDAPVVRRMIERQTGSHPGASDSAAHDLAEPMTDPTRSA